MWCTLKKTWTIAWLTKRTWNYISLRVTFHRHLWMAWCNEPKGPKSECDVVLEMTFYCSSNRVNIESYSCIPKEGQFPNGIAFSRFQEQRINSAIAIHRSSHSHRCDAHKLVAGRPQWTVLSRVTGLQNSRVVAAFHFRSKTVIRMGWLFTDAEYDRNSFTPSVDENFFGPLMNDFINLMWLKYSMACCGSNALVNLVWCHSCLKYYL